MTGVLFRCLRKGNIVTIDTIDNTNERTVKFKVDQLGALSYQG